MRIAVIREIREGERRVALVPESCAKLAKAGFTVAVESGAGAGAFFPDDAFREAGAGIGDDPMELLSGADLVLKVQPPTFNRALGRHEAYMVRPGAVLMGQLVPARHPDSVVQMASRGVTAFAMDRITQGR